MSLTHLAFVLAKPDCTGPLAARIAELAVEAAGEPGCIEFTIHQSSDDPALWFLYSSWQSAEALAEHLEHGSGRHFAEASGGLLEESMDVHSFIRRRPLRADTLAIAA
ncbi:putative quinol monooxygenase [Solimonas soli]|uniref:putative quinol monooxygenase n=1 Tax=Solimonas soli TaxID=413479 RepID=UPI00146FA970|nr:antibiotic biosynthesis monooxygenase family protein [Solimonas soli]